MKVKIGDKVQSIDFGPGKIVAMTKDWCILDLGNDRGKVALTWDDVYIEAEFPGEPVGSISEKVLP